MIAETTGPALAEPSAAKPSRIRWQLIAFVVSVQALLVLGGILLFSAMGLANDGVGSCGGG